MKKTATVEYIHCYDGVWTRFKNEITGAESWKKYATESAAKSAGTRFLNKVNRILLTGTGK